MTARTRQPPLPINDISTFDSHTHVHLVARALANENISEENVSANAPTDSAIVAGILERAKSSGVAGMLTVGESVKNFALTVELTQKYPQIWAALAVHPVSAYECTSETRNYLEHCYQHGLVHVVGETGLDWFCLDKDNKCADRTQQKDAFIWHIEQAKQYDLPLMIHNRNADTDVLDILTSEGAPETVIMHCFSSDKNIARKCSDRGYYVSFSGNVTFKSAHEIREAAALIPSRQLLVETDAPYLRPHPYRGGINEPYCLAYTVDVLAQTRKEPKDSVAAQTHENALRILRRKTA